MKKIRLALFLFLLISSILLAGNVSINDYDNDTADPFQHIAKKTYIHPTLRCVLEAPASWMMDTSSSSYKVIFKPQGEGDSVYVGLVTYISNEPETANLLYLRRAGTRWDRWHLLGKKELDEQDNFLIATDESVQALYSQKLMDENLQINETFVAENIYVKNKTQVYMVTAIADKARWFKYKDEIKAIMKSFYVNE